MVLEPGMQKCNESVIAQHMPYDFCGEIFRIFYWKILFQKGYLR